MNLGRRDFVKGIVAAPVFFLLPGNARGAEYNTSIETSAPRIASRIEKSIKAYFGGGFSVQDHTQCEGLIRADIEHFGNRYAVCSADLLEWEIVKSSLVESRSASSLVSRPPKRST